MAAGLLLNPQVIATKMVRYSQVIAKLQKLLEAERRQVRALRSSHAKELTRRGEVQSMLVQRLELIREEHRCEKREERREEGKIGLGGWACEGRGHLGGQESCEMS